MKIIDRIKKAAGVLFRYGPGHDYWYSPYGGATGTGITVTETSALQLTAVQACIKVLSETVAGLPLQLFERMPDGTIQRAKGHPKDNLVSSKPNKDQTSYRWREQGMIHVLTFGNWYVQLLYDGRGEVAALNNLDPSRVRPKRNDAGNLVYIYTKADGQPVPLTAPPNIMPIPGLGYDGIQGFSPIKMAAEAIGLGLAAEAFGGRFFRNNARPSGIIKHPSVLEPESRDNLRDAWNAAHQGVDNSNKIAILEEGMEFVAINVPPEEAQWLQTRNYQDIQICAIYRVPPHLIANLDKATFTNIESQGQEFVTYTIMPWCIRIEESLNRWLLTEEEQKTFFYKHNVDGLLRADSAARAAFYKALFQMGAISPDEIREKENMNPIPGGNQYFVPLNMVPLQVASSVQDVGNEAASLYPSLRGAVKGDLAKLRSVGTRNRLRAVYKPLFVDAARKIVAREAVALQREVAKRLGPRGERDFLLWMDGFYDDLAPYIERVMRPVFRSYTESVAVEANTEMGADGGMTDDLEKLSKDYSDNWQNTYIQSSKGQIRKIISDAPNEEEGTEGVIVRTKQWEERRPEKVARREVVENQMATAKAVFISLGVTRLVWVTQGSETCPFCLELDGRVVGVEQNFVSSGDSVDAGGQEMKASSNKGHPPLHEGCDCTIIPE